MRKLIMWNLVTLDGCFEGAESWALDWHRQVLDDEFERFALDQLRSADGLVFGRVTYEGMAAYWRTAEGEVARFMNALPKVVVSRTLEMADWENARLVRGDAASAVRELKEQGDGNLFVFGSASLSATLIRGGLFDEYRLLVVPVVLGEGRHLFEGGPPRRRFRLLRSRAFASGGVLLCYAPEQGARPPARSVG
ncbi:MAG: dihydrofolate reductase family protein [Acidobacteriota bacterium]